MTEPRQKKRYPLHIHIATFFTLLILIAAYLSLLASVVLYFAGNVN